MLVRGGEWTRMRWRKGWTGGVCVTRFLKINFCRVQSTRALPSKFFHQEKQRKTIFPKIKSKGIEWGKWERNEMTTRSGQRPEEFVVVNFVSFCFVCVRECTRLKCFSTFWRRGSSAALSHRHIKKTTRKMKETEKQSAIEKRQARTTFNCLTNLPLPLDSKSLQPTGNRVIHGTVGKAEAQKEGGGTKREHFGGWVHCGKKGEEEKRFELETANRTEWMAQSTLKIQSQLYLRKENRNGKVLLLLFISHRKLQGILCV